MPWTDHASDLLISEGFEPEAFIEAAEMARSLCTLPAATSVSRIVLRGEICGWVTMTANGNMTCYEIGEHDNSWDGIWHLAKTDYYAAKPVTWRSSQVFAKERQKAAKKDQAHKAIKNIGIPDLPFGLVWAPDRNRKVMLAEIVKREPLTLRFSKDSDVTMTALETGLTWRPIDRPQEGYAQLWALGRTRHAAFMYLKQAAQKLMPDELTFAAQIDAMGAGPTTVQDLAKTMNLVEPSPKLASLPQGDARTIRPVVMPEGWTCPTLAEIDRSDPYRGTPHHGIDAKLLTVEQRHERANAEIFINRLIYASPT